MKIITTYNDGREIHVTDEFLRWLRETLIQMAAANKSTKDE